MHLLCLRPTRDVLQAGEGYMLWPCPSDTCTVQCASRLQVSGLRGRHLLGDTCRGHLLGDTCWDAPAGEALAGGHLLGCSAHLGWHVSIPCFSRTPATLLLRLRCSGFFSVNVILSQKQMSLPRGLWEFRGALAAVPMTGNCFRREARGRPAGGLRSCPGP